MIKVAAILLFAILLLTIFSSASYVKKASAGKEEEATAVSKVIAANCINPHSCPHAEKPLKTTTPANPITIPPPEKPKILKNPAEHLLSHPAEGHGKGGLCGREGWVHIENGHMVCAYPKRTCFLGHCTEG
jgi:hypothetical protein